MGFLDKFIPNEVKKPFKAVGKLSKKFLPKEIRPWLPMVTPFLPATGILGAMGGPGGFGKMYLANLMAQQAADPDAEFDDLNQFAALLSGTQGGLMDRSSQLKGMTTAGKFNPTTKEGILSQLKTAPMGADSISKMPGFEEAMANRSFWDKTKDLTLEGLSKGAGYLEDTTKTLQDLGSGEMDLFTKAGAIEAGKAAAVPFSTGMGGVTEAYQRPAIREFEKFAADEAAEWEADSMADEQEQADLTMRYYREAGHDEETIKTAMDLNEIGHLYEPPPEEESAAQGGIIGLKNGGMLNFGGREMDLRTGGFVPIGKKERADDVPARLSKNEFVMTADAVRAAGGGSVNKGAQRMYDVMNKLEARA